jgi:hypothetical protein
MNGSHLDVLVPGWEIHASHDFHPYWISSDHVGNEWGDTHNDHLSSTGLALVSI